MDVELLVLLTALIHHLVDVLDIVMELVREVQEVLVLTVLPNVLMTVPELVQMLV